MRRTNDQWDYLKDFTFVFTGTLSSWTQEEAREEAESMGARVTGSVSMATDYLVVGSKPGRTKLNKAKQYDVYIIDEGQFTKILRGEVVPKSGSREDRLLKIQELNIPITDGDISDFQRHNLPALCGCGLDLKRIMKRGTEYAWTCDGEGEECSLQRYALRRQGYSRTDT